MKIAVIGSGIAGMTAAHALAPDHDVHLFEASARLGGHTATLEVDDGGTPLSVDTGFIVFNEQTYPLFIDLLDQLQVKSQPTEMSFSVSDAVSGLEYAGTNLDGLFAQRRNMLSPRFWRLLRDIARFNREVVRDLAHNPNLATETLGNYLHEFKYSHEFRDYYLVPMGAAIWSSNHEVLDSFPLGFFVRFFHNHGLLQIRDRPQWRTIVGGSCQYIAPLTASFRHNIHLSTPVLRVHRQVKQHGVSKVCMTLRDGEGWFDHVIFACHSDQALRLLADATAQETAILGAIPYTSNEVALHTDVSMLPRNRRTWSSWNVSLGRTGAERPALTYNMNILQQLQSLQTWCVTLNQTALIRDECIHSVCHYDHPVFTLAGIKAQQRWHEINGHLNSWYCGAWWRNGFHEDGVWSAQRVAVALEQQLESLKLAVAV